LASGYGGIRCANPLYTEPFLLVVVWTAFTIGPMSADQHEQIEIRRGATSFNMRTIFIKQNGRFEKSQGLKGQSEKYKNS
jgi:hypothetical protein